MNEALKTALFVGIPVVGLIVLFLIIRYGDLKKAKEMAESIRKNLAEYYRAKESIDKKTQAKKARIDAKPVTPFSPEAARKHLEESKEWPPKD